MHTSAFRTFALLPLALCCAHAFAHTDNNAPAATELNDILVSGDKTQRPFLTPSATAYIQPSEEGRDLNDVLRTSAGLYTGHDIGQNGVNVNLRGLEGIGRVNTMIDGVSQTFNQVNPTHGWSGNLAVINEDFMAGAEVERGLSHGASGGNALGGSVNFRTLAPSDLVSDGQEWGGRLTLRHGNNGYRTNGMAAIAHRRQFEHGGSFGALLAWGGKTRGGYKNGAGEAIAGDRHDGALPQTAAVHARSWMAKLEYAPNRYHSFKFSYTGNRSHSHNNHTPMDVTTDSGQLQYRYNPLSDLIDVNTHLSYTHSRQFLEKENRDPDDDNGFHGRTTLNPTWQFNLSNRSRFEWGDADFQMHYGLQTIRTRYDVDASRVERPLDSLVLTRGHSQNHTLFWENELNWGRWTLTGGARYEQYRYGGRIPKLDPKYTYIKPSGGNVNFQHRHNHFNPYVGMAFQATNWLQLYATYAHTSRAPTLPELLSGSSNAANNPYFVNPHLKSETARNRDIGFNIFKQGWLLPNDTARLKVNYFNNRIRNYISGERVYICKDFSRCDVDTYTDEFDSDSVQPIELRINQPDITKIRGWEIEGGYDFGRGYINLSYTRSKSDLPINLMTDTVGNTTDQPESRLIVDVGTRWLDNRLTLGARMTHTQGDSTGGGIENIDDKEVQVRRHINKGRPVFDLYAKYDINRNARLFFNIQNLTNSVYEYPLSRATLGTGNLGHSNVSQGTAPGRTISAGFTLKF